MSGLVGVVSNPNPEKTLKLTSILTQNHKHWANLNPVSYPNLPWIEANPNPKTKPNSKVNPNPNPNNKANSYPNANLHLIGDNSNPNPNPNHNANPNTNPNLDPNTKRNLNPNPNQSTRGVWILPAVFGHSTRCVLVYLSHLTVLT